MKTIIRRTEVLQQTGLSYSTLWRFCQAGEFPRPVQLGANSVGWYQDEITEWIESRARTGGLDVEARP